MTREQEFFLQVLSDHLNGRATNPPDGLDWPQIAKYAKSHEVEGIVYHQCKDYLSKHEELASVNDRLSKATAAAVFYYANNCYAFTELEKIYKEENVSFFSVKGLILAKLYPIPAFRTMGDLDIVLHPEDRERTHKKIIELGYSYKQSSLAKCYSRANQSLEIHDRLVYDNEERNFKRKNFYNSYWDYASQSEKNSTYYRLNWNFHFAFLVDHLMKHFTVDGVGFRQFLDLAVVVQRVQDLDWIWIEQKLSEVGLWSFTLSSLTFCKRWWGIKIPVNLNWTIDEDTFQDSTELIFRNGVFGFDNADHQINAVGKEADTVHVPAILRSCILFLRRLFQPYEKMKNLPYCYFLIGKKYLLPVAWIYRFFYVLKNKKQSVDVWKKIALNSSGILDKREKMLERWGLRE